MKEDMAHIITLNSNTEYITFWKSDTLIVYEKNKVIIHFEPTDYEVTSAVFKNGIVYYTIKDSNVIHRMDISQQKLDPILLYDYNKPQFLAVVNYYDSAFVIADGENRIAVYDLSCMQELHVLPVTASQFRDFEIIDSTTSVMLCNKWRNVARYEDDDDSETITMMSFQLSDRAPVVHKKDSLRIFTATDSWSDHQMVQISNDIAMRLPIFDYYLYYWPVDKSLSMRGKYVVYYCEDIKGLIISSYSDGSVYRILELPEEYTKNDSYYFNEATNILIVVAGLTVHRFLIQTPDANKIDALNELYNEFANAKKSAKKDHSFQKALIRAIDACSIITIDNTQKAKKRPSSVFVSYSSANYQEAKDLVVYLENSGISCWLAPKDVVGGDVFTKEICDAICHCDLVLLILSKASAKSIWVIKEITFAIENQKTIIPIQIEEIDASSHIGLCLSGINRIIATGGINNVKDVVRNALYKKLV